MHWLATSCMFVQHQHPDQWPVCACTCPCTTKNLHLQPPCLPACTTSTCKRPQSEAARTNVCRLCLKSIHHSQVLLRCYSSGANSCGANSSGANSGDTSFSMFANWSGCSVTWTAGSSLPKEILQVSPAVLCIAQLHEERGDVQRAEETQGCKLSRKCCHYVFHQDIIHMYHSPSAG